MGDTRLLGRPDTYHGDSAKWRDWKLGFTAFCGAVNERMEQLMMEVSSECYDVYSYDEQSVAWLGVY